MLAAMMAREIGLDTNVALRAGLPHTVAAQTVNRFCSSGVQTIALGAPLRVS